MSPIKTLNKLGVFFCIILILSVISNEVRGEICLLIAMNLQISPRKELVRNDGFINGVRQQLDKSDPR